MVGRSAELGRLLALVNSPSEERGPRVALIGGEAGIGKSRMLREVSDVLPPGITTLVGRAGTGPPGRPYSVLLDAVEPMVAKWTAVPAALAGRADGIRLLLAAAAPGLGQANPREYGPDEALRAAVELIRHLAPAPALLVFEDLHEADPESLGLFSRVALTDDLEVTLMGTYRTEDVGPALAASIAHLERRRPVTRIMLGRLPLDAVRGLLSAVRGTEVPWTVADIVHRRTGGNPFLVEEVLHAAGDTNFERLGSSTLHWTVTDGVARRLDTLPAVERNVIETAAVLGSRFSFDLLRAVVRLDEDAIIAILRRLVKAGLVSEEEPDVFVFRHALTQEVLARQLLERERQRLHERALHAMEELGSDDYAALAHHASGAGRGADVLVFAARGGAGYLRMGLIHEAFRLAKQGLAQDGAHRELRRLASMAAWRIGLLDVAREHGVWWRQLAATARDRGCEGAALRHLSRIAWEAGSPQEGTAYADQAYALAEQAGPSRDLALAMVVMSEAGMLTIAYEPSASPGSDKAARAAILWADRALDLSDRLGDMDIRPRALVNKGTALLCTPGGISAGMAVLEQARWEAAKRGDSWNHMRALRNMIDSGLQIWDVDRIQAALDEQRDVGRVIGREAEADHNWARAAAELAVIRGDLDGARLHLTLGRRLAPELRGLERWQYAASELRLALEAGETAMVASHLVLAEQNASSDVVAAELAATQGKLGTAVRRLDSAIGGVEAGTIPADRRRPILSAALTLLRYGADPASIRAAVERLDRLWPAWPDDPPALRSQVEAAILEAEAHPRQALAAYENVIADRVNPRPAYLIADAEQGAARCLLATKRSAEATSHAERAVQLLGRWPGWRADQAAALAKRCHSHANPSDQLLTAREREVTALLTKGLTNGEIARRLFISTKTASVHVSNILAKLGMTTRAEVAAWATREGLDAQ
jgi:DNA-binding NarL/FixJ family response regulator